MDLSPHTCLNKRVFFFLRLKVNGVLIKGEQLLTTAVLMISQ